MVQHETTHIKGTAGIKFKIQAETTSTKTTICSVWDKNRKFSLRKGYGSVWKNNPEDWIGIFNPHSAGMRSRFTRQRKQLDDCSNKITFQFSAGSITMNGRIYSSVWDQKHPADCWMRWVWCATRKKITREISIKLSVPQHSWTWRWN